MNRATAERLSAIVMRAVDSLGYSEVCIRTNRAMWNEVSKENRNVSDFTFLYVGSKREGISLHHESDFDRMLVCNECVCSDNIKNVDKDSYPFVFHMDTDHCPAGYTKLRHIDFRRARRVAINEFLIEASLEYGGEYFLSSALLYPTDVDRSGPAATTETVQHSMKKKFPYKQSVDTAFAISCEGESMLQDWISRPRCHGWPPRKVIQRVSTLQGHVVPVGAKGSDEEFLQWRICYTPAEVTMVQALNHVQEVLYILMKMISKHILKQTCSDITSYIIKNLILWMAELLPAHNFTENNLMTILMDGLKILREAARRRYLANYMIPKRNLFSGKLANGEQESLCELLTTMIDQGPRFLVQHPQLTRLAKRIRLVYREPNVAMFEQINKEQYALCCYNKQKYGHRDLSSIPFFQPLVKFCMQQDMPLPLIEVLVEKIMLYFNGYYDFQNHPRK